MLLVNIYEGEEIYRPRFPNKRSVRAAVMEQSFQPIGGDVIKLKGMVDEREGSCRQR